MKVKLIKRKGYYQLVVDDKDINNKYDCSQKKPIILATLNSWEGTKCWSLHDLRLSPYRPPSPYLDGSNIEYRTPVNEEEEQLITCVIKNYEKRGQQIVWSTFSGVVGGGDKTNDPTIPEYVKASLQGCWSFDEGIKQLNVIRDFWETFEGDNIADVKIHNPYSQPTSDCFTFLEVILTHALDEDKKEKAINSWQKIHNISDEIMTSIDFKNLYKNENNLVKDNKPKKKMI